MVLRPAGNVRCVPPIAEIPGANPARSIQIFQIGGSGTALVSGTVTSVPGNINILTPVLLLFGISSP